VFAHQKNGFDDEKTGLTSLANTRIKNKWKKDLRQPNVVQSNKCLFINQHIKFLKIGRNY
jgi:hypothetical protein